MQSGVAGAGGDLNRRLEAAERHATQTADPSLADRLAELERPRAHLSEVRDEGLIGRLYAFPWFHRLIPLRLAIRLARMRGRLEWLVASRRRAALKRMAATARPGTSPHEIRCLARAHLIERAIKTELSWHPWAARRMPVRGLEHLERARSGGRGVILATIHMGPLLNLAHALAARGHPPYVSADPAFHQPILRGHHGRWVKTQTAWIEEAGCRWVWRGWTYDLLRALLERGELCWMNWDAGEGSSTVTLMGRSIKIASGTARLALETGAQVVPGFVWREGDGQVAVLFPAIDPQEAHSESELNLRVASVVEAVVAPRLAQSHAGIGLQLRATLSGVR